MTMTARKTVVRLTEIEMTDELQSELSKFINAVNHLVTDGGEIVFLFGFGTELDAHEEPVTEYLGKIDNRGGILTDAIMKDLLRLDRTEDFI